MEKRSSELNLHQRMELIVKDMVDKDINLKDALREFEKIFFEQAPASTREQDQDGQGPRNPPEHPP